MARRHQGSIPVGFATTTPILDSPRQVPVSCENLAVFVSSMRAHKDSETRSPRARLGPALAWLGGGHWAELAERHQRSTQAIAGLVVLFGAGSAWLAAAVAVGASARWPMPAILPLTLVFGLLVGALTRATASGPTRGWPGLVARAAVAVVVGIAVAELSGLAVLSGSIDRRLAEQAVQRADSAPTVAQASAHLDRARAARSALDNAVEQARAVDTTTQPLRAARQVFEEVEEITFSLNRTRRVTVSAAAA
ncbi:hypothetical protein JMUB5695_02588 [Mycobacterium heckeshornense]|nr:hypothetical protein JMUB5695_02588 [Mycobacterium heckeshornense]